MVLWTMVLYNMLKYIEVIPIRCQFEDGSARIRRLRPGRLE
jgi:hypothetical protein